MAGSDDVSAVVESIMVVRDEASGRLNVIASSGERASAKVTAFGKASNVAMRTAADSSAGAARAIGNIGEQAERAGAKGLKINGLAQSLQGAGRLAAGADVSVAGFGASLLRGAASGGVLGVAITGVSLAIGSMIGKSQEAEERLKELDARTKEVAQTNAEAAREMARNRSVAEGRVSAGGASGADDTEREIRRNQQLEDLEKKRGQATTQRMLANIPLAEEMRDTFDALIQRFGEAGDDAGLAQMLSLLGECESGTRQWASAASILRKAGLLDEDALARLVAYEQAQRGVVDGQKAINDQVAIFAAQDKERAQRKADDDKRNKDALQERIALLDAEASGGDAGLAALKQVLDGRRAMNEAAKLGATLDEQLKIAADMRLIAGNKAADLEKKKTEALLEQARQMQSVLGLDEEQLRVKRDQELVDKLMAAGRSQEAADLADALRLDRERLKAKKDQAKAEADLSKAGMEAARAAADRARSAGDVAEEVLLLHAELQGGVKAADAMRESLERGRMEAKGLSDETINTVLGLRKQVDAARELRDLRKQVLSLAEKESQAQKGDGPEERKKKARDADEDADDKKKRRKKGSVFGAQFTFEGRRMASPLDHDTGEDDDNRGPKTKGKSGEKADKAAADATDAKGKAQASAEKVGRAAELIAGLKAILGQGDAAAAKFADAVKSMLSELTKLMADEAVRNSQSISDLRQQLADLKRTLDQAASSSGAAGG